MVPLLRHPSTPPCFFRQPQVETQFCLLPLALLISIINLISRTTVRGYGSLPVPRLKGS